MKHIVVLCDGMSDYPLDELGKKTPMHIAEKPNMENMAKNGHVGLVKTVADGLNPGSDVANLSVLGYDPKKYYTGRSPLEAASIGIDLKPTDVTLRCNLVTLSEEANYDDKTMVDYCGGDISTEEANQLIEAVEESLGDKIFTFYKGVAYRHCLVWKNGTTNLGGLTPPHDISGKVIGSFLSKNENAAHIIEMMKKSYDILKDHPVNLKRIEKGLEPANSIWLWGEGSPSTLPSFKELYGLDGAIISAVDLLKGIGKLAKMDIIEVENATGYIDTNFNGKAKAAIDTLKGKNDFVYIHVEAPDECGHRGETENKIKAIEIIDEKIIGPVVEAMEEAGEDFKMLVLPDHATPLALKTHVSDPVPFFIYSSVKKDSSNISCFDEENAKSTGVLIKHGPSIMEKFIEY